MWWVQDTAGTRGTTATRRGIASFPLAGEVPRKGRRGPYGSPDLYGKSSRGTSGGGSGAGLRLRRGRMGAAEDVGSSAGSTAVTASGPGAGGGPGADEAAERR